MSELMTAGLWGFVGGLALLLGALVGLFADLSAGRIGSIMAFGAGVLMSAIAFELMDEAYTEAGLAPTGLGFIGGAVVYTAANRWLARWGAHKRKQSGQQPSEEEQGGSGTAIAVGALLDGVPESIVIGLGLLAGGGVSVAMVAAVFISNVPEGLSSSAGMKQAGRSTGFVVLLWTAMAVLFGLSSMAGYAVFGGFSPFVIAATMAVAGGAMLAMITDTMIPEAFAVRQDMAGLIVVAGFLVSFALTKAG